MLASYILHLIIYIGPQSAVPESVCPASEECPPVSLKAAVGVASAMQLVSESSQSPDRRAWGPNNYYLVCALFETSVTITF